MTENSSSTSCRVTDFSESYRVGATLIVVTAYVVFLSFYIEVITTHFDALPGYDRYHDSQWYMVCFSYLLAVIPSPFLSVQNGRVSSSILAVVYYLFYVPAQVVAQYMVRGRDEDIVAWNVLLFAGFCLSIAWTRMPTIKIQRPSVSIRWFVVVSIVAWLLVILTITSVFGIDLKFTSIYDVYGVRAKFVEALSNGPLLVGYLVLIGGYFLSPFLLIVGMWLLSTRHWSGIALVLLAMCLSAYIYTIAAYKSVVFGMLAAAAYVVVARGKMNIMTKLGLIIGLASAASWVMASVLGLDFAWYHVVRRALIVPGMDSSFYFDYFRHNIVENSALDAQLICKLYYNSNCSANAGFFAAAYGAYGALGVLSVGSVFGIMLWLIDTLTRQVPYGIAAGCFFMQSYALSNSALGTVMLSYGLVLMMLALYFMPLISSGRPNSTQASKPGGRLACGNIRVFDRCLDRRFSPHSCA